MQRDLLHPHAVAEERATGERGGRVNGDDAHPESLREIGLGEERGERALPGTGGAGEPDAPRPPDARVAVGGDRLVAGALVLDNAHHTGERGDAAGVEGGEQLGGPIVHRSPPISSCSSWISPTTSSTRSSKVTMPSVSPAPPCTTARCRRSRSIRRISD